MPRTYGESFLRELSATQDKTAGIRLARLCVRANLPAAYVAKALEVSITTIHHWFRNRKGINDKNQKMIDVFISLAKHDLGTGRLPASNTKDAKTYIEEMIGRKI
jgi:hypothetical protein